MCHSRSVLCLLLLFWSGKYSNPLDLLETSVAPNEFILIYTYVKHLTKLLASNLHCLTITFPAVGHNLKFGRLKSGNQSLSTLQALLFLLLFYGGIFIRIYLSFCADLRFLFPPSRLYHSWAASEVKTDEQPSVSHYSERSL